MAYSVKVATLYDMGHHLSDAFEINTFFPNLIWGHGP